MELDFSSQRDLQRKDDANLMRKLESTEPLNPPGSVSNNFLLSSVNANLGIPSVSLVNSNDREESSCANADCSKSLTQENVQILKRQVNLFELLELGPGLPLAAQVVYPDGQIELIQEKNTADSHEQKQTWQFVEEIGVHLDTEQAKNLLNQEWGTPVNSDESVDTATLRTVVEVMEIEQLSQEKRFSEIPAVIEKWNRIDEERKEVHRKEEEQRAFETEQDQLRLAWELEAKKVQNEKETREEMRRLIKEGKKAQGSTSGPVWRMKRLEIANLNGFKGKISKLLAQADTKEIVLDLQRGAEIRSQFNFSFLQNWWLLDKETYEEIVQWSIAIIKELGNCTRAYTRRSKPVPAANRTTNAWAKRGKIALDTKVKAKTLQGPFDFQLPEEIEAVSAKAWELAIVGHFPRKNNYSFQYVKNSHEKMAKIWPL